MTDRALMMFELTRTLARLPTAQPLPQRLCRAYVDVVSARGGAICIGLALGERSVLSATSPRESRYEDLQDFLGEGPGVEVLRTGRAVVSESTEDHRRRWPALTRSVLPDVIDRIHALPVRPGSDLLGTLTVHQSDRGSGYDVEALQFLSDTIGAAILGDLPAAQERGRQWSERDRVSQATGAVVAQLSLNPHDALAVLRAHAFAQGVSVNEVADAIVEGDLDFSRGGS